VNLKFYLTKKENIKGNINQRDLTTILLRTAIDTPLQNGSTGFITVCVLSKLKSPRRAGYFMESDFRNSSWRFYNIRNKQNLGLFNKNKN